MNFYKLRKYFHLFPNYQKDEMLKVIKSLVNQNFLTKEQEWIQITKKGQEKLKEHFFDYPYLDNFCFYRVEVNFWELFLLTNQVLSERSYHEKNYAPISSSLIIQTELKFILRNINKDFNKFLIDYVEELIFFVEKLSNEDKYLFINQLQGHQIYGLTQKQIQDDLQISTFEYEMKLHNLIQYLLKEIIDGSLPIFNSIFKIEKSLPLNLMKTLKLIKCSNFTLKQIADRIGKKESTIIDYMIELGIRKYINLENYLAEKNYYFFEEYYQKNPNVVSWNFSELHKYNSHFTFTEFRFYQVIKGL